MTQEAWNPGKTSFAFHQRDSPAGHELTGQTVTGTVGNCPSLIGKRDTWLSFGPKTFFENPISTHLKLAFSIKITSCYRNHRPDASVIILCLPKKGVGAGDVGVLHDKNHNDSKDT